MNVLLNDGWGDDHSQRKYINGQYKDTRAKLTKNVVPPKIEKVWTHCWILPSITIYTILVKVPAEYMSCGNEAFPATDDAVKKPKHMFEHFISPIGADVEKDAGQGHDGR